MQSVRADAKEEQEAQRTTVELSNAGVWAGGRRVLQAEPLLGEILDERVLILPSHRGRREINRAPSLGRAYVVWRFWRECGGWVGPGGHGEVAVGVPSSIAVCSRWFVAGSRGLVVVVVSVCSTFFVDGRRVHTALYATSHKRYSIDAASPCVLVYLAPFPTHQAIYQILHSSPLSPMNF